MLALFQMKALRLALVIFVISSVELCLDSDAQADGHDFGHLVVIKTFGLGWHLSRSPPNFRVTV